MPTDHVYRMKQPTPDLNLLLTPSREKGYGHAPPTPLPANRGCLPEPVNDPDERLDPGTLKLSLRRAPTRNTPTPPPGVELSTKTYSIKARNQLRQPKVGTTKQDKGRRGRRMTTALLLENPTATAWAERFRNSQETSNSKDDAEKAVRLRTELLLNTDPDDRLSLLESPDWKFKEEHLRQINTVVETFIDAHARRQLKEMANHCLDSRDNAFTIFRKWLTEDKYETLGQMVSQTTVPDHLMTFCYAWLEASETAMAIYVLESHRRMPKPDFENFEQTAEEHEADRRFANLA